VLAVVLALAAFGCGFGALWVQAGLSQPVASNCGSATQSFNVNAGDGSSTIADNLEKQHLIRNANIFKLYMKLRGKTLNVTKGTYQLSPCWNLQQIITVLNTPPSAAYVTFTVREGYRLTQYPSEILNSAVLHDPGNTDDGANGQAALPNFKTSDFINATVTGSLTIPNLSDYWWIKEWNTKGGSLTVLEGYLFPSTYDVYPSDDTVTIIKRMLKGFAEQLCPGPDAADIDQYIFDQTQCMAHQATITLPAAKSGETAVPGAGSKMGVFDALKKYYPGANVPTELQQALTIASYAQREARTSANFFLVASVYYNRFAKQGGGTNGLENADPAEQYWLGRNATGNTDPWAALPALPSNLPNNPYNLYLTAGLSPSAIAGTSQDALYAAIFPPSTNYYYFIYTCDHQNHYEATNQQQLADENQYGGSC
jgi:UPF0755 protein